MTGLPNISVTISTFPQRLSPPLSRGKLQERPDPGHLLPHVLVQTSQRVTGLPTGGLLELGRQTRPELLDLDLLLWSSGEDLAEASLPSNYFCLLSEGDR